MTWDGRYSALSTFRLLAPCPYNAHATHSAPLGIDFTAPRGLAALEGTPLPPRPTRPPSEVTFPPLLYGPV